MARREHLPVVAAHIGPPIVVAVAVSTVDGEDLFIMNLDTTADAATDGHVDRLTAWVSHNTLKEG